MAAVVDNGEVVMVSRQMRMDANVDSDDIVNIITIR
jgi:hypothetical protein